MLTSALVAAAVARCAGVWARKGDGLGSHYLSAGPWCHGKQLFSGATASSEA